MSVFTGTFVRQSASVEKPGVHKVDSDQVVLFSGDVDGWKVEKTCKQFGEGRQSVNANIRI